MPQENKLTKTICSLKQQCHVAITSIRYMAATVRITLPWNNCK